MNPSPAGVAVIALLLFPLGARAGDIGVPSAAYPTIQSAIDASQPGDRIFVEAGTYPERLDLTDRQALSLRGKGEVVVDAENAGPALAITGSRDIVVKNVRFTNSLGPLVQIEFSKDIAIKKCEIDGSERGAGIETRRSHRLRFTRNVVDRIDGTCIAINRDDLDLPSRNTTVSRNKIRGCLNLERTLDDIAIWAHASDSQISDNRIRGTLTTGAITYGIWADGGQGVVISGNKVRDANSTGIRAFGGEHVVEDNLTIGGTSGISARGNEVQVRDNRIKRPRGQGMFVSGADFLGENNWIQDAGREGMQVGGEDGVIRGNRIERSGWVAFTLEHAEDARLVDNVARDNGLGPKRKGRNSDVLDPHEKGETDYDDNDFLKGIWYEFDFDYND